MTLPSQVTDFEFLASQSKGIHQAKQEAISTSLQKFFSVLFINVLIPCSEATPCLLLSAKLILVFCSFSRIDQQSSITVWFQFREDSLFIIAACMLDFLYVIYGVGYGFYIKWSNICKNHIQAISWHEVAIWKFSFEMKIISLSVSLSEKIKLVNFKLYYW